MKNRSSNIELLRIIAALFVLSYHTVNATIDINALELPSRFIMTGLFFWNGKDIGQYFCNYQRMVFM